MRTNLKLLQKSPNLEIRYTWHISELELNSALTNLLNLAMCNFWLNFNLKNIYCDHFYIKGR